MSENLRDKIDKVLKVYDLVVAPDHTSAETVKMFDSARQSVAESILAVVGPELDRLRAEVERWRTMWDLHGKNDLLTRAIGFEAECDDLRARLADLTRKALVYGEHDEACASLARDDGPCDCWLAALASVPEPSEPAAMDRVTGRPATIYTPPEDVVPAADGGAGGQQKCPAPWCAYPMPHVHQVTSVDESLETTEQRLQRKVAQSIEVERINRERYAGGQQTAGER